MLTTLVKGLLERQLDTGVGCGLQQLWLVTPCLRNDPCGFGRSCGCCWCCVFVCARLPVALEAERCVDNVDNACAL